MSDGITPLWLLFCTLISSELILWLPLAGTVHIMISTMHKSNRLLLSKTIPDEKKERILPLYAIRLFLSSIGFLLLLIIIAVPILTGSLLLLADSSEAAMASLTDTTNLLLMTLTSIGYIVIRIRWFNARLFKTRSTAP